MQRTWVRSNFCLASGSRSCQRSRLWEACRHVFVQLVLLFQTNILRAHSTRDTISREKFKPPHPIVKLNSVLRQPQLHQEITQSRNMLSRPRKVRSEHLDLSSFLSLPKSVIARVRVPVSRREMKGLTTNERNRFAVFFTQPTCSLLLAQVRA